MPYGGSRKFQPAHDSLSSALSAAAAAWQLLSATCMTSADGRGYVTWQMHAAQAEAASTMVLKPVTHVQ